jgi:starvation-inducible outer membrane lipoprotein
VKKFLALFLVLMLSGCTSIGLPKSLEFNNAIKTTATTGVTYAVAGPIPALLNLATSIAVDETLPEKKDISKVKTKEQLWAYMWSETKELVLYGAIILLLFTTIISPWALQRRANRKRKYDQYKYEAKLAREKNQRK